MAANFWHNHVIDRPHGRGPAAEDSYMTYLLEEAITQVTDDELLIPGGLGAKAGLGCARVSYKFEGKQRSINLAIPEASRMIAGAGTLKMWIKGDGSTNELELSLIQARPKLETDNKRHYQEHQNVQLKRALKQVRDDYALDGELPINTHGGQLSAGRLHGYGFLHEACVQLRGQGGERQVKSPKIALAHGNGGYFSHQATTIFGTAETLG